LQQHRRRIRGDELQRAGSEELQHQLLELRAEAAGRPIAGEAAGEAPCLQQLLRAEQLRPPSSDLLHPASHRRNRSQMRLLHLMMMMIIIIISSSSNAFIIRIPSSDHHEAHIIKSIVGIVFSDLICTQTVE
jgi:hypothetical protein